MISNQEIFTSDEDEEIHSNTSKMDSIVLESSESGSLDSAKFTEKKFRKRAVIISDSEDEEFEPCALSPRTRMSITGIRPSDLTDSSDDDFGFDEEHKQKTIREETDENDSPDVDDSVSSSDGSFNPNETDDEDAGSKHNEFEDKSAAQVDDSDNSSSEGSYDPNETETTTSPSYHKKDGSPKNECFLTQEYTNHIIIDKETTNEIPKDDKIEDKSPVHESDRNVKHEPNQSLNIAPKYSSVFENSIKDQMSSTIIHDKIDACANELSSGSSDLVEITKRNSIVDISSDDSITHIESSSSYINPPKTIQPKITAILSRNALSQPTKKYVSKEFYDKEVEKLEELRSDLSSAENLLEKVGPRLFDGGKQLSQRVLSLQSSVKEKAEQIVNLVIDDEKIQKPASKTETFFNKDVPNWDDLSAAVNKIQPLHTGKQGLNTFNMQKVLTIERLKDLHGSLETCPAEDVQADDPIGLKISLMSHQKHALAWMNWRENQKPRGGILADDMGLGKTLTMISLVLDFKNREDGDPRSNSDDSEDEDDVENRAWSSKKRRDYYNGGTLVVCPASLMQQWESEVENRINRHKLSVCIHHGSNRDTKPRHLATYDIVVTTYNIVSREAKTHGALFSISWKRVILDEAHVVRNHKSQSSIAVCELRSKYRWALTGTPIQNKEMDVYALLKFLKCTPFDDLGHWKKWIDNKSAGGQQRLNTLMKSLMLRRTKAQLQQQGSLMCLPERNCEVIEVQLDKEEMNVYQKIMTYSKTLFAQFLFQRAEKNNDLYFHDQGSRATFLQTKDPNGAYHKMHQKFSKIHHGGKEIKSHEILVLLLRLRQICCHPGLIDAMLEDDDGTLQSDSDSSQPEMDLLEHLNKLAITEYPTGASSSLTDSLNADDEQHKAISKASARVLQRSNPVFDLSRPSSKMKKVLQTVEKFILNTADKGIIVSQWTSTLNILKNHLDNRQIRTLSLNGSIPVKNRQNIVTEFNDPNSKVKILLLSLTAGGVGLNLVGANHLLLIDLHWNPQLESQAQDRIYRVGQKKPVHIYKFMCKETVEERIKALQDQKLGIANDLLTGAKSAQGSKLTIDDLKGLFGL